ncbi:MAG: hypothetical protein QGF09_17285, partial [Rhodospirillales bacterium]|nr:hypothetical protein [Rhodospirillales bacterium]
RLNAIILMGQLGLSGRRGARRDAFASGKRCNAPERPSCPTEGRVLLRRGVVAHLWRCLSIAMRSAPNHGTNSPGQNDRI